MHTQLFQLLHILDDDVVCHIYNSKGKIDHVTLHHFAKEVYKVDIISPLEVDVYIAD